MVRALVGASHEGRICSTALAVTIMPRALRGFLMFIPPGRTGMTLPSALERKHSTM